MRKLIFNIHLYLALAAAAFVILMGLTGSIMAFEPEIDRLLHRKLVYVTAGASRLSFSEIRAIASKAVPGERIEGYFPSTAPSLSCFVIMEKSGLVYVNPYTGQILGIRPGEPGFLDYVHQLHIRLAWRSDGDPGKKIMSWTGVVMLLLLVSGIVLWWRQKRIAIRRDARGRPFWFDLHNAVGILSFVFLLMLTITGILIGFEKTTVPMFYKLTGSRPSKTPKAPPAPPGAQPISVDQALEIASKAIPGTTAFAIFLPDDANDAYQIRLRYPEDRTPGGRSRVLVGQYSGRVLFTESSRTAPAGARVVIANRAIHTGDIFGIPSKLVMSLASLALVLQAASGLVMWWKRIRGKSRSKNLAATVSAE
jgi:uncharacterized iron-regulated membrane protein